MINTEKKQSKGMDLFRVLVLAFKPASIHFFLLFLQIFDNRVFKNFSHQHIYSFRVTLAFGAHQHISSENSTKSQNVNVQFSVRHQHAVFLIFRYDGELIGKDD